MVPSKSTQSGFDYGIIPQSSPSEASYEFFFPSESTPGDSDADKAVPAPELIEKSSCNPSPTIARLSIESSSQFQVFHHRIFATVYAWSYTSDQWNLINPETWRHAIETGMTENSTWDDVQKLMCICTFQEYYNSITDCAPLRQCYDFTWQDGKICYCIRQQVAASHADSVSSSTTCSDQTQQPANRDPVSSILHQDDPGEWLIVERNGINESFSDLHMGIYDCIQLWMDQPNVSKYPFYMMWRRSVFSGLSKWTDWPRCSQILKLSSLRDYIYFVQQCPLVRDTFDLVWDRANECICYRECNLYQRNDISVDVDKINRFQNQLRAVSNRFDKAFNQLEQRLSNTQEKLSACEHGIIRTLGQTSSKLAATIADHVCQLKATAVSTTEQFHAQIAEITNKNIAKFENHLAAAIDQNIEATIEQRIEAAIEQRFVAAVELCIDAALEKALQEFHTTADEATASFTKQADIVTHRLHQTAPIAKQENLVSPNPTGAPPSTPKQNRPWVSSIPAVAQPSKRFPNVDPSLFLPPNIESRHEPNSTFDAQPTQQDTSAHTNAATTVFWDKYGPNVNCSVSPGVKHGQYQNVMSTGNHSYFQPAVNDGLPYLNHGSLLKYTKEVYPGRESLYTWYTQLQSSVQQWGVLLLKMVDFQVDKCLCPTAYHGITITPTRYREMAFALYQLLLQPTIIPNEFTDLRNIITRHATSQDGYRVLYDSMRRIHPRLNRDAKYSLPQSADTADIHDYYRHLESYYTHEQLAGRTYTAREKVNAFLDGLDTTYEYAITRVLQLMKTWTSSDHEPPESLEFTALPITIEEYMEEAEGKDAAVIRTMHFKNKNSHNEGERTATGRNPRESLNEVTRKFVDARCGFCHMFGHLTYNCDKMAI
jgi:hypothetical protein